MSGIPARTTASASTAAVIATSCVEVCPVDCIHSTPDEPSFALVDQVHIDLAECIDCDACVEACPVDAITAEDQVPDGWRHYIQINADYYKQQKP